MTRPGISVIIPTLGEAARITHLVDRLQAEPEHAEIIVVDGGSSDATIANAAAHGARILLSPRGRGGQLAAGAAAASGDILLFLHADSVFPTGGLAAITSALTAEPAAPGGNFRLIFDGDSHFARWLTGFYARLRRHGLYYGDSGIFVRREVYCALGGIRPLAVMEDYDFVARLERAGRTLCIAAPPLVTSSRNFAGRRAPAIVAGWLIIHGLYHLGAPPRLLWRLYYRHWHAGSADRVSR
jgi:rSAM/selenodomain-associated transferase 2